MSRMGQIAMHTGYRHVVALLLLAAAAPALGAEATATRVWQFKPEASAGLELRNLIGDVRVVPGEAAGFRVTARVRVEAGSQAEAERLLGLVDFRTADTGAASRFHVALPKAHFPRIRHPGHGGLFWWNAAWVSYLGERLRLTGDDDDPAVRVDLEVRAPAGARLEVYNVFGDAFAERVSGELRLDGSSGSMRSTGGEGRLVLDTGSGRVEVQGHRGRVSADTGSGMVEIRDCECEIDADTGSGSVAIRGGAGRLRADTGSGRIVVESFAGTIEADTGSGSVKATDLRDLSELDVDTSSGSVDVSGDLGALARLRIDTGSGSVRLRSDAIPSIEIRVDTGSGGVDVDAPGAELREADDVWILRLGDGAGRGVIDTGSGSVDLVFRP